MSKRARDEGSAGSDAMEHPMLRDAQHKAMSINLQRYKMTISGLEAQLASSRSTSTVLTDVVSVLGRQLVAVSGALPPPHTPPSSRALAPWLRQPAGAHPPHPMHPSPCLPACRLTGRWTALLLRWMPLAVASCLLQLRQRRCWTGCWAALGPRQSACPGWRLPWQLAGAA
jgi:hypothetical protein